MQSLLGIGTSSMNTPEGDPPVSHILDTCTPATPLPSYGVYGAGVVPEWLASCTTLEKWGGLKRLLPQPPQEGPHRRKCRGRYTGDNSLTNWGGATPPWRVFPEEERRKWPGQPYGIGVSPQSASSPGNIQRTRVLFRAPRTGLCCRFPLLPFLWLKTFITHSLQIPSQSVQLGFLEFAV